VKLLKKTLLVSLAAIFLLVSAAIGGFKYFSLKMVEAHQKSVTRSIAAWGDEYSQIRSEGDAFRAVEMMEYISRYYVTPHPGYKGPRASEKKLEEQRALTLSNLRPPSGPSPGRNSQTLRIGSAGKNEGSRAIR
jgi:hypothetical protein